MAIDQTTSTVSLAPNVHVVPGVSAGVEESEVCVGEFSSPVAGEESAARHLEDADDIDSSVDFMSGITAVGGGLRAGLLLMRWHVQTCQWRLWLRLLLTHLACLHVSLLSSYLISFWFAGNNLVATHIFYKLVNSARLFMKKASWGSFVLVFDSSGEPAGHPDFSDSCAPGFSGTEVEVGCTSCEDGVGATLHAPMDYESSMGFSTCCIRGDLGQSHLCSFSGPTEVPTVEFGEGDISTEAQVRRQRRSRSGRISCRLVPLAFRVGTTVGHCWSRRSSMVGIIQIEEFHSGVPWRFLILIVLF